MNTPPDYTETPGSTTTTSRDEATAEDDVDDGAPLFPALKRRRFLEATGLAASGITFAGVFATILAYVWPPLEKQRGSTEPVLVAKVDEIKVGEAKSVMYGSSPVLVVHLHGGWVGLKATCPHLGCIVKWEGKRQGIVCPCHGAVFNTHGQVLSGPSPEPLAQVPVRQVGDKIYLG